MDHVATQLQALVDTAVDGVIQIDARGAVMLFNPACEKLFGYAAEEVIGQNVKLLMPEPFHAEHDGYLRNYLNTGERKIIGIGREVVGRRKDGSTFPMELSVGEAHLDGDPVFVGVINDITERKRSQQELIESAARLRAVVDTAVDGVIQIDAQGRIMLFNPACEKLFDYAADDVIGQNVKTLMPEPFQAEHDGYLSNYLSTGERKIIGIGREVVGRRKGGETFPMELSVGEARQDGEPIFVGVIHDISERTQADAQRQRLIEALTAHNEEQGHFAYGVSHDLKQHVRSIGVFTTMLQEHFGDELDETAAKYIAFMADAAGHMHALVEDLLEYGRLETETERSTTFDSAELISRVIDGLKESIQETGAEISVEPTPALYGNALRFARLMQNLLGNAIKYVPEGATPKVRVSSRRDGDVWEISVSDNGIGIPDAYHERIFEPFQRLHGQSRYRGSGLGLAICKKIVEGFDGRIWVTSAPGEGSTFSFTIPARSSD